MLNSPNIVEMLDEKALNTIGQTVITEFNLDKESRSQWEKRVEEAMMLALQVAETKSFPWSNASNIKFPLVTIAALQFHSRAYPALIPTQDIIKIDCEADPETPPEEQAKYVARDKRVEKHMSYQMRISGPRRNTKHIKSEYRKKEEKQKSGDLGGGR